MYSDRVVYASHYKRLCAPKGVNFLYVRPEMQHLLKPLVVSWGYEPEIQSPSAFVDQHEWIGTRDMAAFLSIPAAIRFQGEQAWDEVRSVCHQLAKYAQDEICNLTKMSPLHSSSEVWFTQLTAAPLPAETDITTLKSQLYDEYKVEIPLISWKEHNLIRVSVQVYNTKKDTDRLLFALSKLLS